MCSFQSKIPENILNHQFVNGNLLIEMLQDCLVNIKSGTLNVTEKGKPFIRNLCMCFDFKLNRKKSGEKHV